MLHREASSRGRFAAFLATRMAFALAVLVFLIYVTFLGLAMARGVPTAAAVRYAGEATASYLAHVLQGDLGTAYISVGTTRRGPVGPIIAQVLPRSVGLLGIALLLGGFGGILLGSWAAYRRRPSVRITALFLATLGLSLPSFFLALIPQIAAIAYTRWRGHPLLPVGGFGWDAHLVLPALVLAVRPLAQVTRVTTVVLADLQAQDFVRAALAKGLPWRQVRWRHILRNGWVPILTAWLASLQFCLSSLPVVELYFGWGGIGQTLLRAIARKDDLLAVPLIFVTGVFFLTVHTALDVTARAIDPRLRDAATRTGFGGRRWRDVLGDVWDLLYQLARRLRVPSLRPPRGGRRSEHAAAVDRERRQAALRQWRRAIGGNPALILGSVLGLALAIVYVAGPTWAPHNPYTTIGLRMVEGKLKTPPFPPSTTYPLGTDLLGRDLLSLLLAGARQTLTLVFLAVLGRLGVGLLLGLTAGWTAGSIADRMVQTAASIIAAFPALLLSMLLILALGIRQGMRPFVIALTFVGWGRVMSMVREATWRLRQQPFIESAQSLGVHPAEIWWRHVLPNLLPTLLVVTAVEAADVLLLVGELGFVGIFLGGGAFAEVFVGSDPYHYSDVPEWAALLSNVRQYARTYPWVGLYPALAFALAVLTFNLLAEGLRQLTQDVRLTFSRLWSRQTLIGLALLVIGIRWAQAHTGPMSLYAQAARAFDGQHAYTHVRVLTQPTWTGRRIGSPGAEAAAEYIAEQFQALGLQPAGKRFSYFLTVKRDFFEVTEIPELALVDETGQVVESLRYREDFAVLPTLRLNAGEGEGRLAVVGFGPLSRQEGRMGVGVFAPALDQVAQEGDVLLLLRPVLPSTWRRRPQAMTLVMTDDPRDLQRGHVYSASSPYAPEYRPMDGAPMFYISRQAAARILARAGLSLEQLEAETARLAPDEVRRWETSVRLRGRIVGEVHSKVPVKHVLAYWPGRSQTLASELIVVLANYDGVGIDAMGRLYPGALDNASGIATLLELARSWKAAGYEPRKSFIFAAYAAYGFDYGKPPALEPDIKQLLGGKYGFSTAFHHEAIIYLKGLGGSRTLDVATGGSQHLFQVFQEGARRAGVGVRRTDREVDIAVIYEGGGAIPRGQVAPTARVSSQGWEEVSQTVEGTPARVHPDALAAVGRAISIALQAMGREVNY